MDCFACARNDDLVRFSEVTLLDITQLVVPAKAGTHNHRRLLRWKVSATAPKNARPRRMGPCFRRNDVEREAIRVYGCRATFTAAPPPAGQPLHPPAPRPSARSSPP